MVYPIVKLFDPVLEREADVVTEFDTPELHKLIDDMFESMYAAKGVGLAAPQIGISRKIAVIDISVGENPDDKLVIINPKIIHKEGDRKSTRLNSSHGYISYAVFCLKKKKEIYI